MLKRFSIFSLFLLAPHLLAMSGTPSEPLIGENFPAPPLFIGEEQKIEAKNLQVAQVGDDHVALKWEADNQILGFRVYFKSTADFAPYAELSGEQESATVANLDASTTYTFRLVALDQFFSESDGVEVTAKTLQKVAQTVVQTSTSSSSSSSSSGGSSVIGTKELTLGESAQITTQVDPTNTPSATTSYTQNDIRLEAVITHTSTQGTTLTTAKIQNVFSPKATEKNNGSLEITATYDNQAIIFNTNSDGSTAVTTKDSTLTYPAGTEVSLEIVNGEAILDATMKLQNNKITF